MFSVFIVLAIIGGGLFWLFKTRAQPDKKPIPAAEIKRGRFKGAMETDLRTLRTKPGENPEFGRR